MRNAECGCFSALGSITVGAMKIMVSDMLLLIPSLPAIIGEIASNFPVVPGKSFVFVVSE